MALLHACAMAQHGVCRGKLPHANVTCTCTCHQRATEQPLTLGGDT